jgi:hypothetical protein
MAKKNKEYTKLPGSKKGFFLGRYTLWQGADHLLQIFARFGVEDYKRFYFSDIQAIVIRKTAGGKIKNAILGGITSLFLLFIFSVLNTGPILLNGWALLWGFMAVVMALFLLVNFLMGPTCETKLLTAVQTEKLHPLNRLRRAIKVADNLRPLIRDAQRSTPGQDSRRQQAGTNGPNPTRVSKKTRINPAKHVRNEKGRVHMVLFGLLLFDAILVTSEFFVLHVLTTIVSSVASLCTGIVVIIALVRQHNSNLPGSLRSITWICLGYLGITFGMGYIIGMVMAFNDPGVFYNQWDIIKSISALSPWDSPLKLSCNILAICGAVFLAIPGLIILQRSLGRDIQPMKRTPAPTGQTAASFTPETG